MPSDPPSLTSIPTLTTMSAHHGPLTFNLIFIRFSQTLSVEIVRCYASGLFIRILLLPLFSKRFYLIIVDVHTLVVHLATSLIAPSEKHRIRYQFKITLLSTHPEQTRVIILYLNFRIS